MASQTAEKGEYSRHLMKPNETDETSEPLAQMEAQTPHLRAGDRLPDCRHLASRDRTTPSRTASKFSVHSQRVSVESAAERQSS